MVKKKKFGLAIHGRKFVGNREGELYVFPTKQKRAETIKEMKKVFPDLVYATFKIF